MSRHDGTFDTPELKEAQLSFRQAEVEETIAVLRRLNDGQGAQIFKDNLRSEGQTLHDWGGMLDVDAITISGHSYGATLAVSIQPPFVVAQVTDQGSCDSSAKFLRNNCPYQAPSCLIRENRAIPHCAITLTNTQRQAERTAE